MKTLSTSVFRVLVFGFATAAVLSSMAQQSASKPAVPLEPIAAILDAFRTHQVVALGEGSHGNEQGHAFRLSLIRDPRFAASVQDIVVEFGGARYQDVMDRFVRGENVTDESLRHAWMNTTQPDTIWDVPIYEEFFRAVRSVNSSLPTGRRLRVLLGDPPIDWDDVRTLEDLNLWATKRDSHAVELIRREVLEKNRRAFVIYGDEHFTRNGGGIVTQLEKVGMTKVFSIHTETRRDLQTLQPGIAAWRIPSLAVIRGTLLGTAELPSNSRQRAVRMEDQFDALLYLGPPSAFTIAQLSRKLCADRAYMEMRIRRMALVPPPPGAPFYPIERLKDYCALADNDVEIPDDAPALTELLRETIRDAATGKADSSRLASESRERLVRFLKESGPRFLGSMGALESLKLMAENNDGGKRVRRYRAVFANGQKITWTVRFSAESKILSLDPRRE